MKSSANEKADPRLYRLYWRYCLTDILDRLEHDTSKMSKSQLRVCKEYLHEFHKRVLNYKTTQGITQRRMESFIAEMCLFWAERGIFVRTKKGQPVKIQQLPLSVSWKWL